MFKAAFVLCLQMLLSATNRQVWATCFTIRGESYGHKGGIGFRHTGADLFAVSRFYRDGLNLIASVVCSMIFLLPFPMMQPLGCHG